MKLFTKSMEPNTTLGVAERVAYMSGNIGIALINTIVATFLMFFYTDVMMLNAGIIGTILMVSRLFDGVTDIIMGMIVDRTHSKYGKARVWVIRTCIPYAISGLLLVCVPGGMTELVQYIYVFITYNICNSVFLTALYVPYNAMTCNITSNPYERGVLGIFVLFGATFGTLAVQSTVDAATKALGGDQRAWQIVVGIYAICGLILHLICFFGTKERCGSTSEKVKIHAKEEMRSLFTNKYWILAIMTILFVMFFTAFTGGAGLYFAKGVLGDTAYYAQFANFMAVTHYKVLERFGDYTYMQFKLETGRTHQIRVHMASINHPLLGDMLYSSYSPTKNRFKGLEGQCLHAKTIGFVHPKTGEYMEFDAPLPKYFANLLEVLYNINNK